MGSILGSSGGLSPAQTSQLQAMLKATSAPATTIPGGLLDLGTPASGGLGPTQTRRLANLTALNAAGTALGATQQRRFTRLSALAKAAVPAVPPGMGLGFDGAFNLARDARMTVLQRQGYKATVATSPLGDANFGTSLSRPMLT